MIHPTAIIAPEAKLGDGVEVGAYAIIDADVEIGDRCRILPQAQILRGCRLGQENTIGRGAILGGDPQDLSFESATSSQLILGKGNTIREHVTLHRSATAGQATIIGDENFLMVGAHIGHDSKIGDRNVLANNCLLAGHVEVGSNCFLGGGSGYHQFLRVGDYVMAQGNGSFSKDLPPFTTAALYNQIVGLNSIGLRRAGYSTEERRELKQLFTLFFRSGSNRATALESVTDQNWGAPAKKLIEFLGGASTKGVCSMKLRKSKKNTAKI